MTLKEILNFVFKYSGRHHIFAISNQPSACKLMKDNAMHTESEQMHENSTDLPWHVASRAIGLKFASIINTGVLRMLFLNRWIHSGVRYFSCFQ